MTVSLEKHGNIGGDCWIKRAGRHQMARGMGQSSRFSTLLLYARRQSEPGQAVLTRKVKRLPASVFHRSDPLRTPELRLGLFTRCEPGCFFELSEGLCLRNLGNHVRRPRSGVVALSLNYDEVRALGRRSSNATAAASIRLRNSRGASIPGNVSLVDPVPVT